MTTTLTERQAIERMMNYNEAERARLYASYEVYLDRLRELDEIDRMNEQAAKADEVMVESYKRTLVSIEDVEQANKNAREEFRKIIPEVMDELKVLLDNMKKEGITIAEPTQPKNLCNEIEQPEPEIPPTNVDEPKEETSVGLEPDLLRMKKSLMRGSMNDNKVVSQFAKVILKEHIKPMKSKDLVAALNKAGIQMNHPNETLRQIRMHEPTIMNVSHGYYQYVKVK